MDDGRLNLVQPSDPYWRERVKKELLPLLKEHRVALLAHYQGSTADSEGERCDVCRRTLWIDGSATTEDVWRTCDKLMCPHFRPEYDSAGWRSEARRMERWHLGKRMT